MALNASNINNKLPYALMVDKIAFRSIKKQEINLKEPKTNTPLLVVKTLNTKKIKTAVFNFIIPNAFSNIKLLSKQFFKRFFPVKITLRKPILLFES